MLKILQISNYYYPHIGGIEQVAKDLSDCFSLSPDIQHKIICFNETASSSSVICHRKQTVTDVINNIEVIRCGCQAKIFSQSLSINYPFVLAKEIKRLEPDIVILHYPNPFVTSFLLTLLPNNTKLFVYWHLDITKQKTLKKLFKMQNIRLIKRADLILGATPKHLNESEFSLFFGNKKYILPYMIKDEKLNPIDEDYEKIERIKNKYKGKTIGFYIGRHVIQKGIKCLIDASKIINRDDVVFLIAGSGELTEQLKKESTNDSKIEFLGVLSDDEKRIYLSACDFFCFPSINRSEGFGLALAEAMYLGKPAITFEIPGSGVNYVNLNNATGIVCPNSDVNAYANAIIKLVDDPLLRKQMGYNAEKRIKENYTQKRFNHNVFELLNKTTNKAL